MIMNEILSLNQTSKASWKLSTKPYAIPENYVSVNLMTPIFHSLKL